MLGRRTTEKDGNFRENPRKESRIPQRKRRNDAVKQECKNI